MYGIPRRLLGLFAIAKGYALIVAILSSTLFTPQMDNTNLFLSTVPSLGAADDTIRTMLAPFASWDGIYFLRIATEGYRFEQQHAFFPLLPFLIKYFGILFGKVFYTLSNVSLCLLSGVLLSNIFHFLNMINVYKLTCLMGFDQKFSLVAASFCALSPSFAFQTGIYSESLFSFLTSSGLIALRKNHKFIASFCFFLAGFTRSNGLLLAGFFIYQLFVFICTCRMTKMMLFRCLKLFLLALFSVSSYFAFQYYGYHIYCRQGDFIRPWCHRFLPNLYSFVQEHYWNVGPWKYYRWNQLPNFIIASPTIFICLIYCYEYFCDDWKRTMTLGLCSQGNKRTKSVILNNEMFPHFVLLVVMLVTTIIVAHVQIIARLFSFQPLFHWIMADSFMNGSRFIQRAILMYTLGFSLIGTILFMNFLPPA